MRYTDPTGHEACDEDGNCYNAKGWYRAAGAPRLSTVDTWKMMILGKYGVIMSDGNSSNKKWDTRNLHLVYTSLGNIDKALEGRAKSMVMGATFKLAECESGPYEGETSPSRFSITFYTVKDDAIRQMNLYHEVGHLIDNVSGKVDFFTNAVDNENDPSWVKNEIINSDALLAGRVPDPYYGTTDATQAFRDFGPSEQWADAFGNFVAGNIDMTDPTGPGRAMHNFVTGALDNFFSSP